MRDLLADRVLLHAVRLRILRAQAARLMLALDKVGLHEAAGHVSTGIQAMDRAAFAGEGRDVDRLH